MLEFTLILQDSLGFANQLQPVFDWLLKWDQTLTGGISLILTGTLVYLYYQQAEILRSGYQPLIEYRGIEIDENHLVLELSNYGEGHATGIELVTVGLPAESEDLRPSVDSRKFRRYSVDQDEYSGRSIRGGESNVPFRTLVGIPIGYKQGGDVPSGFRSGIRDLVHHEVEVFRLHLYIRYQDQLGRNYITHVFGIEFGPEQEDMNNEASFEEVYHAGGIMMFGEPLVDSDTLELDLTDAFNEPERTVI